MMPLRHRDPSKGDKTQVNQSVTVLIWRCAWVGEHLTRRFAGFLGRERIRVSENEKQPQAELLESVQEASNRAKAPSFLCRQSHRPS